MCADAVEADKNDESGGRGEVVECLRQHLLLKQDAMKINGQCLQVGLLELLYLGSCVIYLSRVSAWVLFNVVPLHPCGDVNKDLRNNAKDTSGQASEKNLFKANA